MTGKALRALRLKHGLSAQKAADMVHVSRRTWARWEAQEDVPKIGSELFLLRLDNVMPQA